MAQHAQQQIYLLNSTVQTHHPQIARHVDNLAQHLYYNRQPGYPDMQRKRASPKMSHLANEMALQSYYQNFHDAHPIMLPFRALASELAELIPEPVLDIMRHIGNCHLQASLKSEEAGKSINRIIDEKIEALVSIPREKVGFHVQGTLLLAIYAYTHEEFDAATYLINKAVGLAVNYGMHKDTFASSNAHGSPQIEEMWRRTYWELYVVEALLIGLQGEVSTLYGTESDVSLPCDEALCREEAKTKTPPRRYKYSDLCKSWPQVAGFDRDLPSFGYRIHAASLLVAVILHGPYSSPASARRNPVDIDEIDAALSAWQKQCVTRNGILSDLDATHLEETIFQAQFIAHSATIYLYRPKCSLSTITTTNSVMKGMFPSPFVQPTNSSFPNLLTDQSSKPLIEAANSIAKLLTNPGQVHRHSPFLIHATALELLVHIPALPHLGRSKERVSVYVSNAMGVLTKFERIWPLAKKVKMEMRTAYNNQAQRA